MSNTLSILLGGNAAGSTAFAAHNLSIVGGSNVTVSGAPGGALVFVAGQVIVGGSNVTVVNTGSSVVINAGMPVVAKSDRWSALGVVVSSASPSTGIRYTEWTAGFPGYWAWIQDP